VTPNEALANDYAGGFNPDRQKGAVLHIAASSPYIDGSTWSGDDEGITGGTFVVTDKYDYFSGWGGEWPVYELEWVGPVSKAAGSGNPYHDDIGRFTSADGNTTGAVQLGLLGSEDDTPLVYLTSSGGPKGYRSGPYQVVDFAQPEAIAGSWADMRKRSRFEQGKAIFDVGLVADDGTKIVAEVQRADNYGVTGIVMVDGVKKGVFERGLDSIQEPLTVSNSLFKLDKSIQGQGVGTTLMRHWEDQLGAAGYEQMEVSATTGRYMNGAYTWATYGYDADYPEGLVQDYIPESDLDSFHMAYRVKLEAALDDYFFTTSADGSAAVHANITEVAREQLASAGQTNVGNDQQLSESLARAITSFEGGSTIADEAYSQAEEPLNDLKEVIYEAGSYGYNPLDIGHNLEYNAPEFSGSEDFDGAVKIEFGISKTPLSLPYQVTIDASDVGQHLREFTSDAWESWLKGSAGDEIHWDGTKAIQRLSNDHYSGRDAVDMKPLVRKPLSQPRDADGDGVIYEGTDKEQRKVNKSWAERKQSLEERRAIVAKYNRNHDKANGQFTDGSSGSGNGHRASAHRGTGASSSKQTQLDLGDAGKSLTGYDPKKVIRTKDIDEAVRLIAEGKDVELETVKDVHTLLEKLHAVVQDMTAKGDKAPNFNLCKVTVKGTSLFCAESKGVKRADMPQLGGMPVKGSKADKLPKSKKGEVDGRAAFTEHLKAMEVSSTRRTVKASSLKASQNELVGAKVAGMMSSKTFDPAGEAIFVSRDGYVIDGHHRWASQVGRDANSGSLGDLTMEVVVVDMPITAVLHEANAWAASFGIAPKSASGPVDKSATPNCIGCGGVLGGSTASRRGPRVPWWPATR